METNAKERDPLSVFGDRGRKPKKTPSNIVTRFTDWALRYGIGGYDRETKRRLLIVNMAGYLSTLSSLSFAISFAAQNADVFRWLILGNLLSAILTATAPLWHRVNSIAAALVMTSTVAITLFFFVSELGRDSGIQLNYIGSVAIAFVIFGLGHLRIIAVVTFICIVGNISCHILFETGRVQAAVSDGFMIQMYVLSATTIMIILAVIVWYAFRVAAEAEERSKRLLNNVLPQKIAERLIAAPDQPIADRFDEATVLFADLVGFTDMSKRLEAAEMVYLLNEMFSEFDTICTGLGIEKIKTIGDAYMAVSGVPDIADDHADRVIQLAIGMLTAAKKMEQTTGRKLELRIGVASGPITAGVIGKAKFAYDVWAPTVNLAARLESHGKLGGIHVSEETHRLLQGKYEFELAPKKDMKGIGRVRSWYLLKTEDDATAG